MINWHSVLVGDDLPELGPNLIAALAGLRFIRVRNELLLFGVLGKPRSTKKDEMYCKGLSRGHLEVYDFPHIGLWRGPTWSRLTGRLRWRADLPDAWARAPPPTCPPPPPPVLQCPFMLWSPMPLYLHVVALHHCTCVTLWWTHQNSCSVTYGTPDFTHKIKNTRQRRIQHSGAVGGWMDGLGWDGWISGRC